MDTVTIDLHGYSHFEAKNIIIRNIENFWNEKTAMKYITGHSSSMKSIVKEISDEYKLETYGYDIQWLSYIVVYSF